MGNRSGNWRFSAGLVPTLAVAALLPLLVGLGIWQLQRAEEKRELEEGFEAGSRSVSVEGSQIEASMSGLPRFQQIELTGRFESDRQFLLDNMTDGGAAGYHVLTPFRVDGTEVRVIVDRGWIPKSFGTALLPDVKIDESDRPISGRIMRLPRPGLELEAGRQSVPEWPRIVQFPVMDQLEAALELPLAERALLLDPAAEDGYLRNWEPVEFGPERHLGYAVQWFALAATVLIIYIVLNLKRKRNE